MKKKNFSWMPKSPRLRGLMQSWLGILAINWVFQGMRGMQRKEFLFRAALELGLILFAFASLPLTLGGVSRVLIAFVIAHTFNWLFNCHLWVCVRYFPIYRRDPAVLAAFLARTERLLQSYSWLNEAVCIGSVGDTRKINSERSDIDLRLIFPPGISAWIRVNLLLLRLRTLALFSVIPLDLYAYDSVNALDRFRQDEGLLVLVDRNGKISVRYRNRVI